MNAPFTLNQRMFVKLFHFLCFSAACFDTAMYNTEACNETGVTQQYLY